MRLTKDEVEKLISFVSYGVVNMRGMYKDKKAFDEQTENIKDFVTALRPDAANYSKALKYLSRMDFSKKLP